MLRRYVLDQRIGIWGGMTEREPGLLWRGPPVAPWWRLLETPAPNTNAPMTAPSTISEAS
ncbi:MAG TPA: hypothetical protein VGE95_03620 [Arthrobacter sp.]